MLANCVASVLTKARIRRACTACVRASSAAPTSYGAARLNATTGHNDGGGRARRDRAPATLDNASHLAEHTPSFINDMCLVCPSLRCSLVARGGRNLAYDARPEPRTYSLTPLRLDMC